MLPQKRVCYTLGKIVKYEKKVIEIKIKSLEEYHDLYVQGDALLLADVCNSFRIMCLKTWA